MGQEWQLIGDEEAIRKTDMIIRRVEGDDEEDSPWAQMIGKAVRFHATELEHDALIEAIEAADLDALLSRPESFEGLDKLVTTGGGK